MYEKNFLSTSEVAATSSFCSINRAINVPSMMFSVSECHTLID